MSKKTERKNKTNIVVNWPTAPFFTIEELQELNEDSKNITLRVRLSKKIEQGSIEEIGYKTGGQGRPKKVFAFTPVPNSTRELARNQGIQPVDKSKMQKVVTTPAPKPFAPRTTVIV